MFFIIVITTNRNDNQQNLYKTTTRLRRLMLSPPKQIPIQSLLYPAEKWETMHKKYTSLWLYVLCCYFVMQSLFNIYKHLTYVSPIIVVVRALDSQSRSLGCITARWLLLILYTHIGIYHDSIFALSFMDFHLMYG